jgi:hypothetical protein
VLKNFGLDCCHYISLPSVAFDSMLRITGVEIELLTDIDKILFIEGQVRGMYFERILFETSGSQTGCAAFFFTQAVFHT